MSNRLRRQLVHISSVFTLIYSPAERNRAARPSPEAVVSVSVRTDWVCVGEARSAGGVTEAASVV